VHTCHSTRQQNFTLLRTPTAQLRPYNQRRCVCAERSCPHTYSEQCSLQRLERAALDLNTEDQDVVTCMDLWVKNIRSKYSVDRVRITQ